MSLWPGETGARSNRNSLVPNIRTPAMIPLVFVAALVLLALVTQAGIVAVQRSFPPQGRMIEVEGRDI